MDVLRVVIAMLTGVGFTVAYAMFAKGRLAAAGRLDEPSVVELPEARIILDTPNAVFGLGFYALVLVADAIDTKLAYSLTAAASALALATSVYLGVRLLRQHLTCSRCWTAHVINALLCPLLVSATILTP